MNIQRFLVAAFVLTGCFVAQATVYTWCGPSATDRSGDWEAASNWTVDGETATTYPGETSDADEVWLTNSGTYTITLAANHTVSVFQANKTGDYSPAWSWSTVTVDLGGKRLAVTKRLDVTCETYSWGSHPSDPRIPLSVSFIHGVVSSPSAISVQYGGGTAAAYEKATGVGSGLAWGPSYAGRVRGILGFTGESLTANFNAVQLVSSHSRISVSDGAQVVVTNSVTIGGLNDTPSLRIHVTGERSRFSCKQLFDNAYKGHTNLFENGSVSSVGQYVMGNDYWGTGDGGYAIVRSGATLNLTNTTGNVYCNNQRGLRPMHFVVTGAGSKLTMAGSSTFWIEKFSNSPSNTLDVLDGAVFQGSTDNLLLVGACDGANVLTEKNFNHMVTVSNATLSVGKLLFGGIAWDEKTKSYMYGVSSNNIFRIQGRNGRIEVSGTGRARAKVGTGYGEEGTANLNYNALLAFEVPPEGFAKVPFAVTNGTLQCKTSLLMDNVPACRLEIAARKWSHKCGGETQVLVQTAKDSTAAIQALIDNATFVGFRADDPLPTLSLVTEGTSTSLVMTAPPKRGLAVIVR